MELDSFGLAGGCVPHSHLLPGARGPFMCGVSHRRHGDETHRTFIRGRWGLAPASRRSLGALSESGSTSLLQTRYVSVGVLARVRFSGRVSAAGTLVAAVRLALARRHGLVALAVLHPLPLRAFRPRFAQLAIRNSKLPRQPNAPNRECWLALLGNQSVPPLLADSRRGQLEARTDERPSSQDVGRRARHATLMPGGSLLATPGTGPPIGVRKSGSAALSLQRARSGGHPSSDTPFQS